MQPTITLITLAVADLERAVSFYRDGLKFPTEGIVGTEHENGAVAFFSLQAGLKLALWPRMSLAADTGLSLDGPSATELTLAHNVSSREEVDAVMAQALHGGAKSLKPDRPRFMAVTPAIFRTPIVMSGRSPSIPISNDQQGSSMITVIAMKWAPPFAAGQVRNHRVRWILNEVGFAASAAVWTASSPRRGRSTAAL